MGAPPGGGPPPPPPHAPATPHTPARPALTEGHTPRDVGRGAPVGGATPSADHFVDCIAMPCANCLRSRIRTSNGGSMIMKVPAITMFHSAAARSDV